VRHKSKTASQTKTASGGFNSKTMSGKFNRQGSDASVVPDQNIITEGLIQSGRFFGYEAVLTNGRYERGVRAKPDERCATTGKMVAEGADCYTYVLTKEEIAKFVDTHDCMARKLKQAFDKAIAKMGYTYDQELDYDLSDLSRHFQGRNVFGGGEGGNNSSRDSGGEGTTALSGSGGKPIQGTVVGVSTSSSASSSSSAASSASPAADGPRKFPPAPAGSSSQQNPTSPASPTSEGPPMGSLPPLLNARSSPTGLATKPQLPVLSLRSHPGGPRVSEFNDTSLSMGGS